MLDTLQTQRDPKKKKKKKKTIFFLFQQKMIDKFCFAAACLALH